MFLTNTLDVSIEDFMASLISSIFMVPSLFMRIPPTNDAPLLSLFLINSRRRLSTMVPTYLSLSVPPNNCVDSESAAITDVAP